MQAMNGFRLWVVAILVYSSCSGNYLVLCSSAGDGASHPVSLSLPIVLKYSERGRDVLVKAQLRHAGDDRLAAANIADWPPEGTKEYYDMLRGHDHARLHSGRRQLLDGSTVYTFAAGNQTYSPFADLYYALIDIGTPSKEYIVALDTGTDLLWLPCECRQCANLAALSSNFSSTNLKLKEYSPRKSSTSKVIACTDALCINTDTCTTATDQCSYTQYYNDLNLFSSSYEYNASSSGVLFEDNLYFIPEKGGRPVSSPVVIGCGKNQTGGFLQGFASDGVLGLGSGNISVPSALGRAGVADSFSICLGLDGFGRISFGDIGPLTQQTAPLLVSASGQENAVEIETIMVGSTSIQVSSAVSFDTGFTYTFLATPIFEHFVSAYKQQISATPYNYTGWDICYTNPNLSLITPLISLTFPSKSYSLGPIYELFAFPNQTKNGYTICVGVLDGGLNTIIGQNFMDGFSFTFNRASQLLGWNPNDCYSDTTRSEQAPAPAPAVTPASTPPAQLPAPSTVNASNVPPPSAASTPSSATATAPLYVGTVTKYVNPISPILSLSNLLVFLMVCLIPLL